MQPFQTVNDPGFHQLLKALEPIYECPDCKILSTIYMPLMYVREKQRIGQAVANMNSFAMTTDIWTSQSSQAYTGFTTIHHVDQEFKLQSHFPETTELPESHTGGNIAGELRSIMDERKLRKQGLSALTNDNDSNVVSAIYILVFMRMPCFSHTLQLAVEQVLKLPRVSSTLAHLVSHFIHSAKQRTSRNKLTFSVTNLVLFKT